MLALQSVLAFNGSEDAPSELSQEVVSCLDEEW
jgi:hypothetical protein